MEEWDGRGVGALGCDLYKKERGPALRIPLLLFLPLFTGVRGKGILRSRHIWERTSLLAIRSFPLH